MNQTATASAVRRQPSAAASAAADAVAALLADIFWEEIQKQEDERYNK